MTDLEKLEPAPPLVLGTRRERERSDHELVRASRAGSKDAAEALVERHWRPAHRIAYGILGDAHLAEDVTQEAMLSLLANLGRFDHHRSFAPWLHRIVTNRALDGLRRRNQRSEVSPIIDPSSSSEPPTDPALADALISLPPEQRTVVVLRHIGGYGTNEIAHMLGLRRGTVGSRLRRGLDQLRTRLEETDG